MNRRVFVTGLAAVLGAPRGSEAQNAGRVYRLGVLSPAAPPGASLRGFAALNVPALLGDLGYIEGRNLLVEWRYAHGRLERLPQLAEELVRLPVDVILAIGEAPGAVRQVSKTIPVVMIGRDPVRLGYVASLARPASNVTGVVISETGLGDKRMTLLKDVVPRLTRLAVLTTAEAGQVGQLEEAEKAAPSLGIKLVVGNVASGDYERVFARFVAERVDGLLVLSSAILNADRRRIIGLAAKHRLPAIYQWREHVDEGGLMAYGSSISALSRQLARYIDRIFKGANPAELPLEQPTVYELTVNARTAKALGLTIPPSLLLRADQVIE